ncbi:MAG TPA: DUF1800 domain-containing protein [Vicinamibacterales bacterium]|nr:DUF1800 domain-containing protein [Vicinamibacterales bacterium]
MAIDHLLRRAGFGASSDDLAEYEPLSYSEAVDRLVNYEAIPDDVDSKIGQPGYVGTTSNGPFSPDTVINDARQRWLFRMIHSNRPLQEKMTLFWHNYFATGYSKVAGAAKADGGTTLMNGQIDFLRTNALGNLRDLLLGIAKDPAMLIWLDGDTNTKAKPQENFGRELMELFSRGVGYYTEDDVYAAARVFTGWNLDKSFKFVFNANAHETTAKTFSFPIYADGGRTIPARAASAGMQDGIDLINALAMHQETATRVVTKLYNYFVSETVTPNPAFIAGLADTYLRNASAIQPVVAQILLSPQFQDPSVVFTRYSWPAEFVARAIKETGWTGFSVGSALTPMINMSQQLYEPPNVAGWVLGQAWFSTGAMLARMNFASTLALNQKFRLATAATGARSSPQALVAFMTSRLTAPFDSTSDLAAYASGGAAWTGSDAQLQAKASGLAHLILGSPEYQFV